MQQYLEDTEMQRIHSQPILKKHKLSYYLAVENLMNLSLKKDLIKYHL